MNLVNLEKAVKGFGQRVLLDGVSAGVAAGEAVGVVGRNGTGKSTLLALLAGMEEPDAGRVTRARDLRIGYLPQQDRLTGTVASLVTGDKPEHLWAADPRIRSVMAALLGGIDPGAPAGRLSGGESRRVGLAAVLAGEHDLLLLDEPTNHLDTDAIDWLARFLRERGTAMVVVTHDRWFLDAATTRTWELADGRLHAYDGGYAAYVLARAERARLEDAAQRRRRNLLRKELAWLRRGPPARSSKPRFRIEAANALIVDEPAPRDGVELARLATARLGKTVLEAEDVTLRAGERTLLERLAWQLGPGERVGLVGPNGSGKTTLLRMLAGQAPAGPELTGSGQVTIGKTVRLGFLTQDDAGLDLSLTPREAVAEVRGSVDAVGPNSPGQLLDRLGLRGDIQWTPAGELSGGERRRLQLLRLLAGEPNVLILDEPTNDLDVDTLTELEDMLDGWPGSLLVVSHDRYFLERVTDHVVALLGDGNLSYLGGGIEEYLQRRADQAERAQQAARATASRAAAAGTGGQTVPAASGNGAGRGQAAAQRAAQKEMQRLERQIERLTAREAELSAELSARASDYEALVGIGRQLREVQDERASLEDRWLAAAEQAPG